MRIEDCTGGRGCVGRRRSSGTWPNTTTITWWAARPENKSPGSVVQQDLRSGSREGGSENFLEDKDGEQRIPGWRGRHKGHRWASTDVGGCCPSAHSSVAPSSSRRFHWPIWLACTPNRDALWLAVRSPCTAAHAAFGFTDAWVGRRFAPIDSPPEICVYPTRQPSLRRGPVSRASILLTLEQVGAAMGVTKERVRQIRCRAMSTFIRAAEEDRNE